MTLGGLLAGFIVAKSSFADPRLLCNGWTGLASVGLMMIVLLAGVLMLRGKTRGRLQLAVLISLLVHTAVLLLLAYGGVGQSGRVVFARQLGVPDEQSLPERFRSQDLDEAAEETPIYRQPVEAAATEKPLPEVVERPQAMGQPGAAGRAPAEPEPAGPRPLAARDMARPEPAGRGTEVAAGGGSLTRQQLQQSPLLPGEPIPLPEIKAGGGDGAAAAQCPGRHDRAAAADRPRDAATTHGY